MSGILIRKYQRLELVLAILSGCLSVGIRLTLGETITSDVLCTLLVLGPCVYMRPRYAVTAPLLFFLGSLLPQIETAMNLRLACFSIILILMRDKKQTLPPFILIFSLWATFCLLMYLFTNRIGPSDQHPLDFLYLQTLETSVALILGAISACLRGYGKFYSSDDRPSVSEFYLHTVTFAHLLFLSVVASIVFSSALFALSLSDLYSASNPWSVYYLLSMCFVVPITLSAVFVRFAESSIKSILLASQPFSRLLPHVGESLRLRELDQALIPLQEQLVSSSDTARKLSSSLERLERVSEEQVRKAEKQTRSTKHLHEIFDAAPVGLIALNEAGHIIEANSKSAELLGLAHGTLNDERLVALKNGNRWHHEVSKIVTRLLKNRESVGTEKPIIFGTSSNENSYLQCTAVFTARGEKSRSDSMLTIFIQRCSDTRPLQLSLLSPSESELQAVKLKPQLKQLRARLGTIVNLLSVVASYLRELPAPFQQLMNESTAGMEIKQTIRKVHDSAKDGVSEIDSLLEKRNDTEVSAAIDFPEEFLKSLTYLRTILYDAREIQVANKLPTGEPLMLSVSFERQAHLLSRVLNVIRHLASDKKLKIELDLETIEPATQQLIPGAKSGTYVRVELSHNGLSVSASMLQTKIGSVKKFSSSNIFLEHAVLQLNQDVKELGGFLSIQSGSVRGTSIGVYVPIRTLDETGRERTRSKRSFKPARLEADFEAEKRVLMVGKEQSTLETLSSMVESLGYDFDIKQTDELLEKLQSPLDFAGVGFGTTESTENGFGVLIVNLETATSSIVQLIHWLEENNPSAATILIGQSEEEFGSRFPDWELLPAPFNLAELEQAIERARNRL